MTFVLILLLTYNGGAMTSVDEFKTLAACNAAGNKFVLAAGKEMSPKYFCVEVTK